MAVHERGYRRYQGEVTPAWQRLAILPRYAYKEVFKSKLLVMLFAVSLVPSLIAASFIYLRHNADALVALGIEIGDLLSIDAPFFEALLVVQSNFAFFLTLFVGPGLVSRDLANNGLALYLARPISRAGYVVGKLLVLVVLLSLVTWVPGLVLFGMQGNLEGWSWMGSNLRIAFGLLAGSWLWIAMLSMLALALSAWVRWKAVAGLILLMIFLVGSLFAVMINALFRSDWGHVTNLAQLIKIVYAQLLGTPPPNGPPAWAAWLVILLFAGFCLLLLDRKLRAYEVVR